MTSKQLKAAVVGVALAFTPALYAQADCRIRTQLVPTDDGAAISAAGTANVRQRISPIYYGGMREEFEVQVQADVVDGTTFSVFADGQFAGNITTDLRVASLNLDSELFTLPSELRPVCNLSVVEVTDDSGTLILSGNF